MNFKNIFLSLLLACSLTSIQARIKPESKREVTAKRILSYLGLPYKDKNKLLECATASDIYFLTSWILEPELPWVSAPELAPQEREKIVEILQYLQQEKPELVQEAFDRSTSEGLSLNIERIKALVKFGGAKPRENFKDKNYNAIEKLEARLGQRKINGIRSLNCNPSTWEKFWGQNDFEAVECYVTQKALDFLKQEETKKTAIEKANEIAFAAEDN